MKKMLKATKVVQIIVSIFLAMTIIGVIFCFLSTIQSIFAPASKYASESSYYDVTNFYSSLDSLDIMGTDLKLFENAGQAKALLITTNIITLLIFSIVVVIFALVNKIMKNILDEKTPFTEKNCKLIFIIAIISAVLSVVGSDTEFFFNLFIIRPFFGDLLDVFPSPLEQFRGLSYSPDISIFLYTGIVFLLYYVFKYGLVLQKQDDELI